MLNSKAVILAYALQSFSDMFSCDIIHPKQLPYSQRDTDKSIVIQPQILCSGLSSSLQEGHWCPGVRPKKSNKADEGSTKQGLWGAAEETGIV